MGVIGPSSKLLPPWKYVHSRLLGVKKKRPMYDDPNYTAFSTVHIMTPEIRRVSSKYGTSILTNALPTYKRLRLAEDSLMLARLSKGVLKYIYKVKVDNTNYQAVAEIIDEYKTMLKRARAINIDQSSKDFSERYMAMGINEDLIIPVWGDVNDLAIEELGGKADIRWIVDIEELRNQLASALRTPLQMLGGYTGELPSGLGRSAIERYDIRFARQSRRLQRSVIDAIYRLCQIHLSYMGLDPNTNLFEVAMPETSTAEEEELKESLDKGADVVTKMVGLVVDTVGENVDRVELLEYWNEKILKLDDFDVRAFLKEPGAPLTAETRESIRKKVQGVREKKLKERKVFNKVPNIDLYAHLPEVGQNGSLKESTKAANGSAILNKEWEANYSQIVVLSEQEAKKHLKKQKRKAS
jgi:hypothetical protein